MARTTRSWMAGFILGSSLVGAAPASAQDAAVTTLMVFVVDYVGVPASILEHATEETTRIFRGSNVEVLWLKKGDARFENPLVLTSVVTVHILSREMVHLGKMPKGAMGWAARSTRVVKVSYIGVQALVDDNALLSSNRRDQETACILGHIVAHEIGHLLLPSSSHASAGIMRARLDRRLAVMGALFFSADEAQGIQTKLAKR